MFPLDSFIHSECAQKTEQLHAERISVKLHRSLHVQTRKVIAEILSIAGAIRQQCTSNLFSGGHRVKVEPDPGTGLESSHSHSEAGEVSMPHYEFVCKACKKTFSKILTIAEHDAEKTACPHCGSCEVEQRWSAFSAITSKKSA